MVDTNTNANQNSVKAPVTSKEVSAPSDIPSGFDISAGRVMGDGWAKKEKGNIICGRLLGRHAMEDDRAFYQVELSYPCKAFQGKGDDTQEVTLQKGDVVNIDESKAVQGMRKYIQFMDHGGVYDVWIKYGEKQKLDGGNTFWPIENGPRLKEVKKPKMVQKDDVPF
jgi:hypothetical protein